MVDRFVWVPVSTQDAGVRMSTEDGSTLRPCIRYRSPLVQELEASVAAVARSNQAASTGSVTSTGAVAVARMKPPPVPVAARSTRVLAEGHDRLAKLWAEGSTSSAAHPGPFPAPSAPPINGRGW